MKIAFFDTKPYDRNIFEEHNKKYNHEIKFFRYHLTTDTIPLAQGYEAVCIFVNDILDEKVIQGLNENGVKLIALRSAGYNNVDFKAAHKKLRVVRVPAYSPHAVAEHTIALMLTLNRKIHRAYYRTRDANFSLTGLIGFDMYKKKAGIIGTGKVGKTLAKTLRGFEMDVLLYDIQPDQKFANQTGCTYVKLDDLFEKSDIISLNCPLTKETEYMINDKNISKMKEGVMLINTGRGKLIRTADLIEGLKSRKIGSAGLDVYEEESEYFFEDLSNRVLTDDILARLLSFNNVLITSHQGFFTKEALNEIARVTLQNIQDFADGKPLENELCYSCSSEKNCSTIQGTKCSG